MLREKYPFSFDSAGLRRADLAGFAQLPRDARSSCIAVIDEPGPDPRAAVASYHELGAPVVLVCNGQLQRWRQTSDADRPVLVETIEPQNVGNYFAQRARDFSPQVLFRWKTIGRVRPEPRQQDFVDAGLLPAVEYEIGSRLTERVESAIADLTSLFQISHRQLKPEQRSWILQSTFFLLAAKLLKDKAQEGALADFADLDLLNVDDVFGRVAKHYGSDDPPTISAAPQRRALMKAAERFSSFRYLGHITTDTLADVYEAALVDSVTRRVLGTHSTPSYIVDWMVWHLLPWIEAIDPNDRHVFEPACGHAPFLVSAMRLLRFLLPTADDQDACHEYLKAHLHGLDKDDRAREVARLSLTLSDIPNPNGWDLRRTDMFEGGVLERIATQTRIFLCNPPFEEFTDVERAAYARQSAAPVCAGKAPEMLRRVLPALPEGAVFGVVLPQAVLQSPSSNLVELRDVLVREFQLSEICLLNDRFFRYADHETALLLGRKVKSRALHAVRYNCRKVREDDTNEFITSYKTTACTSWPQDRARSSPERALWVPDLPDVWDRCTELPRLCERAHVERGLNYRGAGDLPANAFTCGAVRPTVIRDSDEIVEGYAATSKDATIHASPATLFMNLSRRVVGVRRGGASVGRTQLLLNYVRVSRGPWRWKSFIDWQGRPFESCYLAVRPKKDTYSFEYWWAVLNGPLANAFVYAHTMKRQNLKGMLEQVPVPRVAPFRTRRVVRAVKSYFEEVTKPIPESVGPLFSPLPVGSFLDPMRARRLLLQVDAEVLRLYDLPAVQERALLDLFAGYPRPGLPDAMRFESYYPSGFNQAVPLYIYLSEVYEKRRLADEGEFLSSRERERLNELLLASRRRRLRKDEIGELEALRLAQDADAFATGGDAAASRAAAIDHASDEAERRAARLVDRIISEGLRGAERAGES